ncbi:hypothetical protein H310_12214 [Aphanomyces invadans]|uniref:Uncharacterized protein n=1 Tax=Aphanomyces invadans TaxID=157072 RepID=A0A024TKL7_9STRA|nr:hypothetical protein H310_12214 [Aphanomyces invadans]ETV93867.1 hypothetical protein H310_12214 [Aphanomyces invadans]|eukprot:XP_008877427.1 hypothetical protein H310_12214 [Aphanomyces invadans]
MNEYGKNFAERRKELQKMALYNLEKAQARQKEYSDLKKAEVEFKVGEKVMLATRGIPLEHVQYSHSTSERSQSSYHDSLVPSM